MKEIKEVNEKKNNYLLYLLELIMALILIFATNKFLSTINFIFVIILSLIGVVELINFIMDKDGLRKNSVSLFTSVVSIWMALFIYKYGDFLFLEMLPVLISLLLFLIAASTFTKYLEYKKIAFLIVSIIYLVLGIILVFAPSSAMYTLFKIAGIYIIITIIFDIVFLIKNK